MLNIYNTSWKYKLGVDCDTEFADYLKKNNVAGKSVFHFGTGEHHLLGIHHNNNYVLGVTASKQEYNNYIDLVTNNTDVALHYNVLFCDIYTMNKQLLPHFDYVNLFHLFEYSNHNNNYGQKTDEQLLKMFVDNADNNTVFSFFNGSNHYAETKALLNSLLASSIIRFIGNYKSLEMYRKY